MITELYIVMPAVAVLTWLIMMSRLDVLVSMLMTVTNFKATELETILKVGFSCF